MSMSRRTRKQMVGKIENEEQALREEELRQLQRELRWLWWSGEQDRQLGVLAA
jgi:hypothetical protein